MNNGEHIGFVFDWDKAARIIAERKPDYALAGLRGDYGKAQGYIWRDGKPDMDDYTYLASIWAMPILTIVTSDGEEEIPCFVLDYDTKWGTDTKWPESALKIIEEAYK